MSEVEPRWASVAAAAVERAAGFRIDRSSMARIRRCVSNAASEAGLSVNDYVGRLSERPSLVQELLERVTVQESWFFRDHVHIDALISLFSAGDLTGTVWSLGCANGQEPFSIAIALTEAGLDNEVIGADLSVDALARVRAGRYATRELRGLSAERQARWLRPDGDGWVLHDDIRDRVRVLHHNVARDDPPMPRGTRGAVFCRNVLIYLETDEVARLGRRLAEWMAPGSWLFVGPSETLGPQQSGFRFVRVGETYAHRRVDANEYPPPRRSTPGPAREPGRRARLLNATRPSQMGLIVPAVPPLAPSEAAAALAAGRRAAIAGDLADAVTQLRRATYLDPDDPVAHLELGIVLASEGDTEPARRALSAARAALTRFPGDIEGFQPGEVARLIDERMSSL